MPKFGPKSTLALLITGALSLAACLPTYDPEEVTFQDQDNNNGDANNGGNNNTCESIQAEVCDGVDNDCDGQVDEDFPRRGVPCGNNIGVCAGVTICEGGAEVCLAIQEPTEELCDGLDNDCDGMTDELTQDDPENCGACGNVCSFDNGVAACQQGSCALLECADGYEDCDRDPSNGCETNTTSDPTNCGACGNICGFEFADTVCNAGECAIEACQAGRTDCNGVALDGCEADLALDTFNCGACGAQCVVPNAVAECLEMVCSFVECQDGFTDLDGTPDNGCEVGLRLLGSPPDADLGNLTVVGTRLLGSAGDRLYSYTLDGQGAIGPLQFDTSLGSDIHQLDAQGQIIYASLAEGDVRILDATDPSDVITSGLVVTSGPAPGFARRDPYLYVADGRDGLRVVDINNPAEPRPVGQAPAPGVVTQVHLSGDRALLSTPGSADLFLYDISTPNLPSWLGSFTLQAGYDRAVFSGDLLITGSTSNGTLRLYRVADSQVTFLGQTSLSGRLVDLEQRFPFLVAVTAGTEGQVYLDLVDIRRPQRPALANTYTAPLRNPPRSASFAQEQVFVAGSSGLQRFDISDLRQPDGLQDLVRPQNLRDIQVEPGRLYVAADGAAEVIDNSDPQNPRRIARLGDDVRQLRVTSDLLLTLGDTYPVSGYSLLALADGVDPSFTIQDVARPNDIETSPSGRYLYALYNGELRTLDPAPPEETPSTLSALPLEGTCRQMLRNQTVLYLACSTGLYLVRPDAPETLTNLGNMGGGDLYGLYLQGQTLYGLTDNGVAIYNAQSPDQVSLSGNVTFEGFTGLRYLTGVGTWLAIGQASNLHLVSRADLLNPTPVAVRSLPGSVRALDSDGQEIFAGTSQGVLRLGVEAP